MPRPVYHHELTAIYESTFEDPAVCDLAMYDSTMAFEVAEQDTAKKFFQINHQKRKTTRPVGGFRLLTNPVE